jgi:hypothetical protein
MFVRRALTAFALGGAIFTGASAYAADATSPPAAAPAPAAATAPAPTAPPSAAALADADKLLLAMGVKESIARTVPTMMTEFEQNVGTSRPEIRESLRETLTAIKPQFDKSAQDIYAKAEALLALAMTEKDLADVTAFFQSAAGKKYLEIEPMFFQRLQDVLAPWRQELSTSIVDTARAEMKKKGIDF